MSEERKGAQLLVISGKEMFGVESGMSQVWGGGDKFTNEILKEAGEKNWGKEKSLQWCCCGLQHKSLLKFFEGSN